VTFNPKTESVFNSIEETAEHLYTVDQLWFNRILGNKEENKVSFRDAKEAAENFNGLHLDLKNFLKGRNLSETVLYKNSLGEFFLFFSFSLWI
jgi:uncharacterized damage-inducible protein DinB